jgi:hypothetical protein
VILSESPADIEAQGIPVVIVERRHDQDAGRANENAQASLAGILHPAALNDARLTPMVQSKPAGGSNIRLASLQRGHR